MMIFLISIFSKVMIFYIFSYSYDILDNYPALIMIFLLFAGSHASRMAKKMMQEADKC